jgi:hypothetical protein
MCYDALKKSNKYSLDYSESRNFNYTYDFVVINYHHQVNNWITFDIIKNFKKPTFCIVTEVTFDISPINMSPQFFNHYIVLDPTIIETQKIHAFGRPLEDFITLSNETLIHPDNIIDANNIINNVNIVDSVDIVNSVYSVDSVEGDNTITQLEISNFNDEPPIETIVKKTSSYEPP